MRIEESAFGSCPDGRKIKLYTLINKNEMSVSVSDLGAVLVKVLLPDNKGGSTDVVLGFDRGEAYFENPSFFGAVIGPSANRIAGASFEIDNTVCRLDTNDGGNNLHSHKEKGYHRQLWDSRASEDGVTFELVDRDGNMGFPGEKRVSVTYSLDDENRLQIRYHGTSDKKTILNLTNHSYFNLDGHGSGTMEEHELWLGASRYTPVAAGSIPTGELADVAGTPMDFTVSKKVGRDINADFEQLKLTGGYDHNWVIDGWDGTLRHFATVKAPESGRIMKAYTTLPGVQFYAGNFIGEQQGKDGAVYGPRMGLCLETQYFPDSIHHNHFPSCVFGQGREYDSMTVYQFE